MNYSFKFANKNKLEIEAELQTNSNGLEQKQANILLKSIGKNTINQKNNSAFNIFKRQFKSAFIYLLIGAMVITFALGEHIDSLLILIFILLDVMLGFWQEYKSEKIASLLQKQTAAKTEVKRNNTWSLINAEDLVPGDLVRIKVGDKITADLRIIETNNLAIDESALTGENIPVYKQDKTIKTPTTEYFQATNLAFSGTNVISGDALGYVINTGKNSTMGTIDSLTQKPKISSEFEKGINQFSNFILKLVGITIILVLGANLIIKGDQFDFWQLMIFCIALTIGVIPEALPLVSTFSLSHGARKLSKQNVLVKRLSSIENMGSIEILFSDKTGTLTENSLTPSEFFPEKDKNLIMKTGALASDWLKDSITEPFDLVFWENINLKTKNEIKKNSQIIKVFSFDPKYKRNANLIKENGEEKLITRGATEQIINLCELTNEQKNNILMWSKSQGEKGKRTMAIAQKNIIQSKKILENIFQEKNYQLVGLVSFHDPIKKDASEAIKKAEKLGVQIKILTGDAPEVSNAVAFELELISDINQTVTGTEWNKLDLPNKKEKIKSCHVFSRFSPEQKYELIEIATLSNVVGFLGEGINDAPALKRANVSLVVNSASDIAREVADIVLLDKSLSVIIGGIVEGRRVFANTTKYIKTTLASNFGNFFAVATASLLVKFLPMMPIQILLVNLLSDVPMIAIATDSVDDEELIKPKNYEVKEIILFAIVIGLVSTIFDFMFFAIFNPLGERGLQTNWFISSILTELILIFSIRTSKPFYNGKRPSWVLMILSTVAGILTITITNHQLGNDLFNFTKPSMSDLQLIFILTLVYFFCNEFIKMVFDKKNINIISKVKA